MQKFHDFDLPEKLLKALDGMAFTDATPIQAQTIPASLEGKDVLGTAQTGTGKTGAFAIPLAAKLLNNPKESLIVLTPTRELAMQVCKVFKDLLTTERSIKTALLIGGESIGRQFSQLRNNPRVIVGTPGRINDHLNRGTLDLRETRSLVLDESDLMLDMGFDVQIETIIEDMPEDRQTLMFSATLPRKIESMAGKYLKNPVRVSVGQQSEPGKNIEQETLMLSDGDKYSNLLDQLDQRTGSIIIFVKTKRGADRLSTKLNDEDHKSAAIHGDLRQSKRDRVLQGFRNQKYRIMVATDVAARGIDVPHIRHVINYDLPQCPEDYIHRIGRTARAGEKGSAVSFVTRQDRGKWGAIERLLDPNVKSDSGGGRGSFSRGGSSRGGFQKRDRGGFGGSRDSGRGGFGGSRGSSDRPSFKRRDDRNDSRGNDRGNFGKSRDFSDRPSFKRRDDRNDSRGNDRGGFGGSRDSSDRPSFKRRDDRNDSRGNDRGGFGGSRDSSDRPSFKRRDGRNDSRGNDRGGFGGSKGSSDRPSFKKRGEDSRSDSRGGFGKSRGASSGGFKKKEGAFGKSNSKPQAGNWRKKGPSSRASA
ncbi:MAG TPA: hypothetical protein DD412_07970 [Holosporales bacterium]|nr:hypothetical protein [Holosporales bacterium]